jgi:hypothetical protein
MTLKRKYSIEAIITSILGTQIVLSFFAPTLQYGSRHIFLSDVFCFIWVVSGLAWALRSGKISAPSKKRLLTWVLACAASLLIVYGHGYFRPSVRPELSAIFYTVNPESDLFHAKRELVFFFRYLIWFYAAGLVVVAAPLLKNRKPLLKTLVVCVTIEAVLMTLGRWSPAFKQLLGKIYGYSTSYDVWETRAYGTFASPVEAGAVLGLAAVLILGTNLLSRKKTLFAFLITMVGLLLTHTMTAIIGVAIAGAYISLKSIRMKRYLDWVYRIGALLILSIGAFEYDLLARKKGDLLSRIDPWLIYLKAVVSRWDRLLFGLGLPDYSIDNSYLFILIHAGLLGVFCVSLLALRSRKWIRWTVEKRAVLIYLLVTGTMFDVIIYRNVVYLMLTVGLLFLSL